MHACEGLQHAHRYARTPPGAAAQDGFLICVSSYPNSNGMLDSKMAPSSRLALPWLPNCPGLGMGWNRPSERSRPAGRRGPALHLTSIRTFANRYVPGLTTWRAPWVSGPGRALCTSPLPASDRATSSGRRPRSSFGMRRCGRRQRTCDEGEAGVVGVASACAQPRFLMPASHQIAVHRSPGESRQKVPRAAHDGLAQQRLDARRLDPPPPPQHMRH